MATIGVAALIWTNQALAGPAILNAPDGRNGQVSANVEGFEFIPNVDVTVAALGVFDGDNDGGLGGTPDGLVVAVPVGIYDSGCQLMVSATVPAGTGGALLGEFRYVAITPTVLNAGQTYRIGALVTNPDSSANSGLGSFGVDPAIDYIVARRIPFATGLACPLPTDSPLGTFGANFVVGDLTAFCGNGTTEAPFGEACDDGNVLDGDCCDSSCQYESAGSSCSNDGNVCTDDVCDGAGTCGIANSASCDDGVFCNGADACAGGVCTHAGDPCVGGPACADACNESADTCLVPAGTACPSDGNPCNVDKCDGAGTCGLAPAGCKTAGKASLQLKKGAVAGGDKLTFKWLKGAETTWPELGEPIGATDYTLCVYAGSDQAAVTIPAGPGWKPLGPKGFTFKEPTGTGAPSGAHKVVLKTGAEGKAKALVKGKGAHLPDTLVPMLSLPVTAQLFNDETVTCFEAVFDAGDVIQNDSSQFKAKQ